MENPQRIARGAQHIAGRSEHFYSKTIKMEEKHELQIFGVNNIFKKSLDEIDYNNS